MTEFARWDLAEIAPASAPFGEGGWHRVIDGEAKVPDHAVRLRRDADGRYVVTGLLMLGSGGGSNEAPIKAKHLREVSLAEVARVAGYRDNSGSLPPASVGSYDERFEEFVSTGDAVERGAPLSEPVDPTRRAGRPGPTRAELEDFAAALEKAAAETGRYVTRVARSRFITRDKVYDWHARCKAQGITVPDLPQGRRS
ncbi:hypothetical protein DOU17_06055 [Clavibacter michiganensis subsp. michiganensis]|nr:hypothetical protein [Clavibacter michiganensis subsp. michiganensis]OUD96690.1 hypothetical protein CMMCAS06_00730 [Clavibacter michiganensis subsp. michiganensis]OUE06525.1 hypothetical protein CMMCAS08_07090 [Clavibacter michiganensis subsp. michiganensis]